MIKLIIEKLEGIIETIAILADKETMKSLRKSIEQANRGEWVSEDLVFPKDESNNED